MAMVITGVAIAVALPLVMWFCFWLAMRAAEAHDFAGIEEKKDDK